MWWYHGHHPRVDCPPGALLSKSVTDLAVPDLALYAARWRPAVDAALDRAIGHGDPPQLWEAMRYAALGPGKRVRPILVLAACEAAGGKPEDALPAAAAIEMVHAFSLVHDDLPCMDDDDYRRGKPTNHKVYGEAIALLAGDGLTALAFETVAATEGVPADRVLEVTRLIARATGTHGMIGGQVLDTLAEGKDVELSDVEQIHRRKTGALLETSVVVGGILGGASKDEVDALRAYGRNIGLAFQVADDILDLTGDSEKLGKSTGSDLRQKKATYPSVIGIDRSGELGNKAVEDALSAISAFDERAEPLRGIARFIMERDK